MSATLILVTKLKTARAVSRAFGATLIPPKPKFKDLQKLTVELAAQKTVVGFLPTLAVGWHAPSNTTIVIHPECDGADPALIVQAKARPKPIIDQRVDTPAMDDTVDADLSKKQRLAALEKRLKTLLQAVSPFCAIGKGFKLNKSEIGPSNKMVHVALVNMDKHVTHFGLFDSATPEYLHSFNVLQAFLTSKKYDETKDQTIYAGLPNEEIGDLTVGDFVELDNLVSNMLKTVAEDTHVVPVKETTATPEAGKAGVGSTDSQPKENDNKTLEKQSSKKQATKGKETKTGRKRKPKLP